MRGILQAFKDKPYLTGDQTKGRYEGATEWISIDPNIREQEMGTNWSNLQGDEAKECRRLQREVIGRFYYRFPAGESGADVYARTKHWWYNDALTINEDYGCSRAKNIVVVTHGLTMRFILMVIEQWSVNTFETVWNANNCSVWVLEKDLSMAGPSPYRLNADLSDKITSTRAIGVTFKNGAEPKVLDLDDYLSIPPPRTRQFGVVKQMLADQHG